MNAFFLRAKKLHLWLLVVLALIAAFHLAKHSRPLMNALAEHVTQPMKQTLAALSALVPFSVAEVLIAAALGVLVLYICAFLAALARRQGARGMLAYRRILGLVCAGLTVYVEVCVLWGVNYYTDSFQERSGIRAGAVSVEALERTTVYFAQKLNETSGDVERDETGAFNVPRDTIYEDAVEIYRGIEEQFPFLALRDHRPKAISFSRLMSATNFTGFFCPFTGEANLNNDSPACLLPSTVAHEMAHQRGIASEEECNFLAILACEKSGNAAYEYSGWLFGFIHLSNALYSADQEAWEAIHSSLNAQVQADLQYNNAYWAQFEGATAEVSQDVYDNFLKSYGDTDGIQSYGAVVDLLVTYYGERTA